MNLRARRLTILGCITAIVIAAPGGPAGALPSSASLSVLHVAEGAPAAQVVDVYAGSLRIIDDLRPGELRAVRITRGQYAVEVFPDGQRPGLAQPLAAIEGLRLAQDTNVTVALHQTPDGTLTATDFANSLLRNPPGQGRVTIRHLAIAPPIDVQIGDGRLIRNLANSDEITLRGLRGDQDAQILQSDSATELIQPRRIPISRPVSTVLYVWGSTESGLRVALQSIPVGTSRN